MHTHTDIDARQHSCIHPHLETDILYTWKHVYIHLDEHTQTHTLTACSYGEVQINIDVDQWWCSICLIKVCKVFSGGNKESSEAM